jgi:hypothetical protein
LDTARLEQICTYRRAGLKLSDIHRILETEGGRLSEILEKRLAELNDEVEALREQQRFVLSLLQEPAILAGCGGSMDKQRWTLFLRGAGFSHEEMLGWHVQFEERSPEKHQQFLELLGIPPDEIKTIRSWSQTGRAINAMATNS